MGTHELWGMVNVTILALRNAEPASIADSRRVFLGANEFLQARRKPALFHVQIAGAANEVPYEDGRMRIFPDLLFTEVKEVDLIIVPSLSGDMMSATHLNRPFGHWIASWYKAGAEVASLSTGAFILAFSGLLKTRLCTTHWAFANEFKHYYPSVDLVDERVMTDQQGLYSSAGGSAYWNLLLHLVEKYAGREIAIYAAKYFVIDIDRSHQSPFIVFEGQKDHDDDAVREIQVHIEQHYKEKLTVEQLADLFHMTRRTLERRFKKATRNTVAEYVQRVKMEGAKKQLEIGRRSIYEVMSDIGYSDMASFREVFKRITGMTPTAYKEKYYRR
jgi:transcriptional regulator GlxA family with amidase domain